MLNSLNHLHNTRVFSSYTNRIKNNSRNKVFFFSRLNPRTFLYFRHHVTSRPLIGIHGAVLRNAPLKEKEGEGALPRTTTRWIIKSGEKQDTFGTASSRYSCR
jgi:hypothetical protein